jgi:hypothetical protein
MYRQSLNVSGTSPTLLYRHGADVDMCIDLVDRGLSQMHRRETYIFKYRDLLQAARSKVYGANLATATSREVSTTYPTLDKDTGLSEPSERIDFETGMGMESSSGNGMESYFNQVSGYFDNALVGLDDNLTAWHDAFLDEIQSTRLNDG